MAEPRPGFRRAETGKVRERVDMAVARVSVNRRIEFGDHLRRCCPGSKVDEQRTELAYRQLIARVDKGPSPDRLKFGQRFIREEGDGLRRHGGRRRSNLSQSFFSRTGRIQVVTSPERYRPQIGG